MGLVSFTSITPSQRGFWGVLLFYIIGLGGTAILAQFVPLVDMCNPGLPFLTGIATLGIGACMTVATIGAYLFGYGTATVKGMLAAHSLLLVSMVTVAVILSVPRNA